MGCSMLSVSRSLSISTYESIPPVTWNILRQVITWMGCQDVKYVWYSLSVNLVPASQSVMQREVCTYCLLCCLNVYILISLLNCTINLEILHFWLKFSENDASHSSTIQSEPQVTWLPTFHTAKGSVMWMPFPRHEAGYAYLASQSTKIILFTWHEESSGMIYYLGMKGD